MNPVDIPALIRDLGTARGQYPESEALIVPAINFLTGLLEEIVAPRMTPRRKAELATLERLERQMSDYPADERVYAITERMGISRSKYYKLRKLLPSRSPQESTDGTATPAWSNSQHERRKQYREAC